MVHRGICLVATTIVEQLVQAASQPLPAPTCVPASKTSPGCANELSVTRGCGQIVAIPNACIARSVDNIRNPPAAAPRHLIASSNLTQSFAYVVVVLGSGTSCITNWRTRSESIRQPVGKDPLRSASLETS